MQNLFNVLLSADPTNKNGWVMWLIIGVVLVLMIVLTIVPQKKRQKQQQEMMNSLNVGTKLMTVGGLVGKITQVNTDNTLIVNVGTENSPTLIVIDKKAVGYVLEGVAMPAPVDVDPVEESVSENSFSEANKNSSEVNENEEDPQVEKTVSGFDGSDENLTDESSDFSDLNDPFGR